MLVAATSGVGLGGICTLIVGTIDLDGFLSEGGLRKLYSNAEGPPSLGFAPQSTGGLVPSAGLVSFGFEMNPVDSDLPVSEVPAVNGFGADDVTAVGKT